MDRFLLADNPMGGNTFAIIHTQQPISIVLVDEGHIKSNYAHHHYNYTNADGVVEQYTLSLYHFFTTSFDGEHNAPMVDKLFKNAWHWYMSYMQWEDNNIDTDNYGKHN